MIVMIYLLEILCQCCAVATFKLERGTTTSEVLTAVSFSAHWIALGLFTGEYLTVAYQTPLLRLKTKLAWFPTFLIIFIVGLCAALFYGQFGIGGIPTLMAWLSFIA